jgi:hypothetical protein
MANKRKGRPPADPDAVGSAVYHLGMRFDARKRDALLMLVDAAIERAREAGVPDAVTPSSLVALWIRERIELEVAKHPAIARAIKAKYGD